MSSTRRRRLHFVVPGPLDQRTGGYLYDTRMVEGLQGLGWTVVVHSLDGVFPRDAVGTAERSLQSTLSGLPDDALVVLDGLGIGAHPVPVAAHADRLRLVALVHHPLADETGLGASERDLLRTLERHALESVRGVVVTSSFTAERLLEYGVAPERIRAVIPGTDPLDGGVPPEAGDEAGRPEERAPLLLSVGTVTPRKGHDALIAALERIQDLQWECVCAGSLERDPEYAAEVRSRAEVAGLGARVHFVGELREDALADLYRHAALFVLASHYEGYGMALTEALMQGLPVVSTTGGAIPHTVPPGAGILVPPGDVVALAEGLRALLADPARRAAYAAQARAHAARLPGWSEQVREFEHALQALGTPRPQEASP